MVSANTSENDVKLIGDKLSACLDAQIPTFVIRVVVERCSSHPNGSAKLQLLVVTKHAGTTMDGARAVGDDISPMRRPLVVAKTSLSVGVQI